MKYGIPKTGRVKKGKFKNTRINRKTRKIYVFDVIRILEPRWWWYEKLNMWVHDSDPSGVLNSSNRGASNHFTSCHSERAFRRHLRKHKKYLPKGLHFRLSGRFQYHHITAKI